MTDVSIEELAAFAEYQRRWSGGSRARGADRVLGLCAAHATPGEILAVLEQEERGDLRDAAVEFVHRFRMPVRDDYVDAVVEARHRRDIGLPVAAETLARADAATDKESTLASLIDQAHIRDCVRGIADRLNADDEASGRPLFSWLGGIDG